MKLDTPSSVAASIRDVLPSEDQEAFFAIPVDSRLHGEPVLVALGTLGNVAVHARDVFRAAVRANASGVILAHNHPSGDPTPSRDDRAMTGSLEVAGQVLGIPVLDHVIVTADSFASMAELGYVGADPHFLRAAVD